MRNKSINPSRRKRDYRISQRQFCETWQKSDSPEECAKKLGMPKSIAIARAAAYRHAGIPLKKMVRKPRNRIDVEALTRFVSELDRDNNPSNPDEVSPDIERQIQEKLTNR